MIAFFRKVFAKSAPLRIHDLSGFAGTVYVVGDVHGCLDLLLGIEARILNDIGKSSETVLIVYVGDLIDRGPDSFGVIEHLQMPNLNGVARICVMGNHEEMMLRFVTNPPKAAEWLDFGGRETLLSYGASHDDVFRLSPKSRKMRFLLDRIIPEEHLEFLAAMPHAIALDSFSITHAGVNPAVPLDRQNPTDLLWGHADFLATPNPAGRDVVHGHFIAKQATHAQGKVSVDTGAYQSGTITAAKLQADGHVEFLTFRKSDA